MFTLEHPMRVTAETKARTRQRLLAAGREHFAEQGVADTTVRDLARSAGIAAGTVFNYFPGGKDELALAIVEEATEDARAALLARSRPPASCAEALFAHVASELRELESCRRFVAEVTGHVSGAGPGESARSLRDAHMETVRQILADHGRLHAFTIVGAQLYWTLYAGVLTHWASDDSRGQSETLALLDEAIRLFVLLLDERRTDRQETTDVTDAC